MNKKDIYQTNLKCMLYNIKYIETNMYTNKWFIIITITYSWEIQILKFIAILKKIQHICMLKYCCYIPWKESIYVNK